MRAFDGLNAGRPADSGGDHRPERRSGEPMSAHDAASFVIELAEAERVIEASRSADEILIQPVRRILDDGSIIEEPHLASEAEESPNLERGAEKVRIGETRPERAAETMKLGDTGFDNAARAAFDRIVSRLDEAANVMSQLADEPRAHSIDPEQLQAAEAALAQMPPVKVTLQEMLERGHGQEPDAAFSAVALTSALTSDVESASKRWPRRLWDAALRHIKDALPQLWAFISRLVAPTQWTVTGTVGTGIFGFADVSASVTFGQSG